MIAVRVLLPVDEMIAGSDFKRIAGDRGSTVRSGPQAHDVRGQPYRPGIAVDSLVAQCNADTHGISCRTNLASSALAEAIAGKIIQERVLGPGETPFQLFYGKDMNFGKFGSWTPF